MKKFLVVGALLAYNRNPEEKVYDQVLVETDDQREALKAAVGDNCVIIDQKTQKVVYSRLPHSPKPTLEPEEGHYWAKTIFGLWFQEANGTPWTLSPQSETYWST